MPPPARVAGRHQRRPGDGRSRLRVERCPCRPRHARSAPRPAAPRHWPCRRSPSPRCLARALATGSLDGSDERTRRGSTPGRSRRSCDTGSLRRRPSHFQRRPAHRLGRPSAGWTSIAAAMTGAPADSVSTSVSVPRSPCLTPATGAGILGGLRQTVGGRGDVGRQPRPPCAGCSPRPRSVRPAPPDLPRSGSTCRSRRHRTARPRRPAGVDGLTLLRIGDRQPVVDLVEQTSRPSPRRAGRTGQVLFRAKPWRRRTFCGPEPTPSGRRVRRSGRRGRGGGGGGVVVGQVDQRDRPARRRRRRRRASAGRRATCSSAMVSGVSRRIAASGSGRGWPQHRPSRPPPTMELNSVLFPAPVDPANATTVSCSESRVPGPERGRPPTGRCPPPAGQPRIGEIGCPRVRPAGDPGRRRRPPGQAARATD